MDHDQLRALVDRIEGAAVLDLDLAVEALQGLRAALPESSSELRTGVVESTDAALHLVIRKLPGWSIVLEGTASEPRGRWTCTLRPSVRDDEEVIGVGRAPTPPLALIAALLRVVVVQAKGYR